MSVDIVIVFIFFAGPIRGYSPGGRVNNFYSYGRRGNSHFVVDVIYIWKTSQVEKKNRKIKYCQSRNSLW